MTHYAATDSDEELLFPVVNPRTIPLGSSVLVQLKNPVTRTKSGLIIPEPAQQNEKDNITTAKILKLGAIAFKHRKELTWWPEHDPEVEGSVPIKPGQFARVPRYGGDRWRIEEGDKVGLFVLFQDTDIRSLIDGDFNDFKTFY